MTADPMQRAREMLAATYEPDHPHIARSVREDDAADFGQWFHHAIAAIQAALLTREEEVRGEERERCARIADGNRTDDDSMWDRAASTIAAAIRADREG